jgi:hypothetical protein
MNNVCSCRITDVTRQGLNCGADSERTIYSREVIRGFPQVLHLCQCSQDLVVGVLGLVAGVEQQRVTLGPPGIVVANSPDCDTDAVLLVDASLDYVGPVRRRSILDVDLSHGTLGCGTAKSCHGGNRVGTLASSQVGLRTNTVNGNTCSNPFLDVADHGGRLRVRSRIEAGQC